MADSVLGARVFARFEREPERRLVANFQIPVVPQGVRRVVATFDPSIYREAQVLRQVLASGPTPHLIESNLPLDTPMSLLREIRSLLSPDNFQEQDTFLTAQVKSGLVFDYAFPSWTRHLLITNRSAGAAAAGQLYYWYDNPSQGNTKLPQNYATLRAGQSASEGAKYEWLSIFADTTCVDAGWELRWSGRPGDAEPVAAHQKIKAPKSVGHGHISEGYGLGGVPRRVHHKRP